MKVKVKYDESESKVTPYSFVNEKKGCTTESYNYPNYMRVRLALQNLGIEVISHEQKEVEKKGSK